jgi:adenylate cyclase
VLPFQTLSDDPDQSWFGDGVARELVSALARFRELFVISANSSFRYRGSGHDPQRVARELGVRYLLDGSIQRGAKRVRIVANLIDAATGVQIWADRVDGDLNDIFALQDELTDSISGVLVARITVTERNRRAREPTARWQAYDYYLRATDPVRLQDIANFEAGWAMMEKAIELDPGFAPAYAEMAWYCLAAWLDPRCSDRFRTSVTMAEAWTYAQTAVRIDPLLPAAHASLGMALLWRHELDQSLDAFARAAELNPNMADGRHGQALVIAGQSREAIALLRRAMRIDPHCTPIWHAFLGHAYLMLDEPEAALGPLRTCTAQMPGWRAAFVWLAATCERLGMTQESGAAAASVLRIGAGFTVGEYDRLHQYVDRPAAEALLASLRRLGLPE